MLKTLTIKNIVLIEDLQLTYNSGLSVFSGETGAGKSIILYSLGLAIGMRADFSLIRKQSNEGIVIAEFEITKDSAVYKKILDHGLGSEKFLILRRVLNKDGSSKAYINDNPVTVSFLREIGLNLVEIHGQNEKIGLLDPSSHIKILDKYSKSDDKIIEVSNNYYNYNKLSKIYSQLNELQGNKNKQIE